MSIEQPSFLNLAMRDGTPKKAFKIALIVGTILTLINQGDLLVAGEPPVAWKVLLTYMVPYCVATWGACTAKRAYIAQLVASRSERL